MNKVLLGLAPLVMALAFTSGCSSFVNTDVGAGKINEKPKSNKEEDKVAPDGLVRKATNPISPDNERQTTVSRPQVIKAEELGQGNGGNKYFDVIDKTRKNISSAPVYKEAAPLRIITYNNGAVAKDFNVNFDDVWTAVVESMLNLPLSTVDKPSGIITTDWTYDDNINAFRGAFAGIMGGGKAIIRYKYTIRVKAGKSSTQILVVPHAQLREARIWAKATASAIVTEKMFERIELEIASPIQ